MRTSKVPAGRFSAARRQRRRSLTRWPSAISSQMLLALPEPRVGAAAGEQLVVRAGLDQRARPRAPRCGRRHARATCGGWRARRCGRAGARRSSSHMAAAVSPSTLAKGSSRSSSGGPEQQRPGDARCGRAGRPRASRPRSPTSVARPSRQRLAGRRSAAPARRRRRSPRAAPSGRPKAMFSASVAENR